MKNTIFLFGLAALLSLSSCDKDEKSLTGVTPAMTFTESSYDFGSIHPGDVVSHVFHFVNNGGSDLIISNAVGSCGCTVPEYPHEPVHAGETGEIKVTFNSAGKSGFQSKSVIITANTAKSTETISITASITTAG